VGPLRPALKPEGPGDGLRVWVYVHLPICMLTTVERRSMGESFIGVLANHTGHLRYLALPIALTILRKASLYFVR